MWQRILVQNKLYLHHTRNPFFSGQATRLLGQVNGRFYLSKEQAHVEPCHFILRSQCIHQLWPESLTCHCRRPPLLPPLPLDSLRPSAGCSDTQYSRSTKREKHICSKLRPVKWGRWSGELAGKKRTWKRLRKANLKSINKQSATDVQSNKPHSENRT